MRTPSVIRRGPTTGGPRGPTALGAKRHKLPFETAVADDPFANAKAPDDDIEAQTSEVSEAVKAAYSEAERKQQQSYKDNNSSGYYRIFVFESGTQAEEFMRKARLDPELRTMDGRKLADAMGIELDPTDFKPQKVRIKGRLAAIALPMRSNQEDE